MTLIPKLSQSEILTYEEILRVVRVATRLGISKVRVTGGEPLVRKGVYDFFEKLIATEGLKDVSLTTNGVLLKNNLLKIKSAGITRINVSLDTLNRKKYRKITGSDEFDRVWQGIEKAQALGAESFKLFVSLLDEIRNDVVSFSFKFFPHAPGEVQQQRRQPVTRMTESKQVATNIGLQAPRQGSPQVAGKMQPVKVMEKVGRNDPCPCGSGKKYKQCHGK